MTPFDKSRPDLPVKFIADCGEFRRCKTLAMPELRRLNRRLGGNNIPETWNIL